MERFTQGHFMLHRSCSPRVWCRRQAVYGAPHKTLQCKLCLCWNVHGLATRLRADNLP